jgi:hypothetical protein
MLIPAKTSGRLTKNGVESISSIENILSGQGAV